MAEEERDEEVPARRREDRAEDVIARSGSAAIANLGEGHRSPQNLIEAINILGSIFLRVVLGISSSRSPSPCGGHAVSPRRAAQALVIVMILSHQNIG